MLGCLLSQLTEVRALLQEELGCLLSSIAAACSGGGKSELLAHNYVSSDRNGLCVEEVHLLRVMMVIMMLIDSEQ